MKLELEKERDRVTECSLCIGEWLKSTQHNLIDTDNFFSVFQYYTKKITSLCQLKVIQCVSKGGSIVWFNS